MRNGWYKSIQYNIQYANNFTNYVGYIIDHRSVTIIIYHTYQLLLLLDDHLD